MSEAEVDDILAKEGRIEAKCEFCATVYVVERPEILELRAVGAWAPKPPTAAGGGSESG